MSARRRRPEARSKARAQAKAALKTSRPSKPLKALKSKPPSHAKAPPRARRPTPAPSTVEAASRDFTAALGSAAHEIKNGLGPLAMTLQLVERKLLGGESVPPQDLSFARAQVRRLSHLVNDLLDVTHLDTDQFPLRIAPRDLAATVAEAVDTFQRGNVRQIARALPSAPVPARFDGDRIIQVLLNLLENAVKYAPLPAPVSVTLVRTPAGARVEVRDGGPGLSLENRERVFARFVRARDEADGTRGLGLGLYLCRSIIERHGGRIGVDSDPGQGATFWFELPS
jgi:signal transduction histidine kinase